MDLGTKIIASTMLFVGIVFVACGDNSESSVDVFRYEGIPRFDSGAIDTFSDLDSTSDSFVEINTDITLKDSSKDLVVDSHIIDSPIQPVSDSTVDIFAPIPDLTVDITVDSFVPITDTTVDSFASIIDARPDTIPVDSTTDTTHDLPRDSTVDTTHDMPIDSTMDTTHDIPIDPTVDTIIDVAPDSTIDTYASIIDSSVDAPSVSDKVLDPAGIPISIAADQQSNIAIAHNGTNALVVWQDVRNGNYDIYGARVSTSGTVLDPTGIAITTHSSFQWHPSVASNGSEYMVTWDDNRGGNWDIYGARVSSSGTVLNPSGIVISSVAVTKSYSAITHNGTNYMVVWGDRRSGTADYNTDIYGTRLTNTGTVLDPLGIAICTASNLQGIPDIAYARTHFLAVWLDKRNSNIGDIYGARISNSGSVLEPSGIAISTAVNDQSYPAVINGGHNDLVVWQDQRNGGYDIYGARVSDTGTVSEPSGIAISTLSSSESYPSIGYDLTNWMVVWSDYRNGNGDVYGTRINTSGVVLDSLGLAFAAGSWAEAGPVIKYDGTNYLVAWEDYRNSNYDIYGTRVTP